MVTITSDDGFEIRFTKNGMSYTIYTENEGWLEIWRGDKKLGEYSTETYTIQMIINAQP